MIVKEKLASLSMCYSITLMELNGREYCISASEEREGEIVIIDTETKAVSKIAGLSGGVMTIIPIPEKKGAFLAIQKFYPVFDSRAAEVVCCQLPEEVSAVMEAKVELVAHIPYVHRIGLTGVPGARKIVAATLCKEKDFTEDWSRPGAVYEYTLDGDMHVTNVKTLTEDIFKNHGMYTYFDHGVERTLISGEGGAWSVDPDGNIEKFCDEFISDLCMFDADGDGEDEMVCIAPFHGDHMKILKKSGENWNCVADEAISFGHAVWCGLYKGAPHIITCSRGEHKSTRFYPVSTLDGQTKLPYALIDVGVGATNIYVKENADGTIVLYAANHGAGEVCRYQISL